MHPLTQVFFESITQLGNFSFIESVALKNIIMHFEIANFNFTHRESEYFEYVYSNPFLNCSMVAVYLLGVVSCFGLRLVSWFEQSGQAGPHRTLVNRLMSLTLDQVRSVTFLSLPFACERVKLLRTEITGCFSGHLSFLRILKLLQYFGATSICNYLIPMVNLLIKFFDNFFYEFFCEYIEKFF